MLEEISEALRRYYDVPENVLPHDEESESGNRARHPSTWKISIGNGPSPCPAFAKFVQDAFDQYRWVPRDPFALSGREALTLGWEEFKHAVKHETRFVFTLIDRGPRTCTQIQARPSGREPSSYGRSAGSCTISASCAHWNQTSRSIGSAYVIQKSK